MVHFLAKQLLKFGFAVVNYLIKRLSVHFLVQNEKIVVIVKVKS